jgi:serine/threonine protein kinase
MDLIKQLLVVDPSNRSTAKQALESDWIKNIDDDVLANVDLDKRRLSMRSSISSVVKLVQFKNNSVLSDVSIEDGRASF